ncbi:Transcriptional repressor nrdR [[Leptolyngbya] sp. PCC 7376]|uniref:transcriptional regulator NrdR n=1 Tax=[Leptolyngbya] sp. PCC 7376 TaxID=111781 RepID=UPI00029F2836|nr:transcriptional regulator NrdR [[Leptolyngbya] sp. PCC 7376]AFY36769.1 Transcriptional repressor nrdR [[Leptolyngbya] sp. PCC 7376]
MHCPYCDHTDSRVLESRATGAGRSIRRRRECLSCKHRFTTYERIEFVPISVVKRNGQSETFDRSKLIRGMARACEKTAVSPSIIETITEEIETQLQQSPKRSISTDKIGELVLHRLRQESEVAYVRFASVYRQFQDVDDFINTLNHLQDTAKEASEWLQDAEEEGNNNIVSKEKSPSKKTILASPTSK